MNHSNKALGLLLNAQQLINQLNKKEEDIRNSMAFILFSPYKGMTKEMQGYFFQLIQALIREQDYYQAVSLSCAFHSNVKVFCWFLFITKLKLTRSFANWELCGTLR